MQYPSIAVSQNSTTGIYTGTSLSSSPNNVGYVQSYPTAHDQFHLLATQSGISNAERQVFIPDNVIRSSTVTTRSFNNSNEYSVTTSITSSTQCSTMLDLKPKAKDLKKSNEVTIDLTSSDDEDDTKTYGKQASDGQVDVSATNEETPNDQPSDEPPSQFKAPRTKTESEISAPTLSSASGTQAVDDTPVDKVETELSKSSLASTMVEATVKAIRIDSSKVNDDTVVEKEKKDDDRSKSKLNCSSSITSSSSKADARST